MAALGVGRERTASGAEQRIVRRSLQGTGGILVTSKWETTGEKRAAFLYERMAEIKF